MKKLFENNIQKFNSLESEQYLIGAMLQHLVDDYELPNYLSIELYSLNKHVLIVEAIDWVLKSGMEFSVSEVVNILKINDKLSYIGGETYLNALASNTINKTEINTEFKKLFGLSSLRKLTKCLSEYIENENFDSIELQRKKASYFLDQIFESSNSTADLSTVHHSNELLSNMLNTIDKSQQKTTITPKTYLSKLRTLEMLIGGINPGSVVSISSDKRVLSTQLIISIVNSVSFDDDGATHYFCSDITKSIVMNKLLSLNSGIELPTLLSGDLKDTDWPKLTNGVVKMKNKNLSFQVVPTGRINSIQSAIRKLNTKIDKSLNLVVIEELYGSTHEKHESVLDWEDDEYLSVLKQIAVDEQCTIIYSPNTEGKDDIHKQSSCSYIDYKVHLSSYPLEALTDDKRVTLSLCVLNKENEYIGECNLIWDRSTQEMYQRC
ncbi:hypothetical protein A3755_01505 [Oleiphilus sp. HI0085]|nr:hypothetical protein A3741_17755 [Oleiphilus sp. HI0069]KZZ32089.1 hypothetical protein A3755_01505 [Oleiphilus sp. HI0085]